MIIVTCYLAYTDLDKIPDEAIESGAVELTIGGVIHQVDMVSIIGDDTV